MKDLLNRLEKEDEYRSEIKQLKQEVAALALSDYTGFYAKIEDCVRQIEAIEAQTAAATKEIREDIREAYKKLKEYQPVKPVKKIKMNGYGQ